MKRLADSRAVHFMRGRTHRDRSTIQHPASHESPRHNGRNATISECAKQPAIIRHGILSLDQEQALFRHGSGSGSGGRGSESRLDSTAAGTFWRLNSPAFLESALRPMAWPPAVGEQTCEPGLSPSEMPCSRLS